LLHVVTPAISRASYWIQRVGILDLALVVLAFFFYSAVREAAGAQAPEATSHAMDLVQLEMSLGLFQEQALQDVVLSSDLLVRWFNGFYAYGFFPPIYAIGLFLFFFQRERYIFFRNAFLISGAIGLVVFHLYPMAPPRLLPWPYGMVDTLTEFSKVNYHSGGGFVNEYAAMPSLHAGWNLLISLALISAFKNPGIKAVGVLMPVMMALSVVATGNHFILDIAAGYVVAGLGLAGAVLWRNHAWRLQRRIFGSSQADVGTPAVLATEEVDARV
jgi:membrane-associated phospholipid phosphatase